MVKSLTFEVDERFKLLNEGFGKRIEGESLYEICIDMFFKSADKKEKR